MIDSEGSGLEDRLCWYVIHTKPRQEERAESNLRAWQVETYMPKVAERSRQHTSGGQSSYIVKPLFPRYLFARFKANELLHKVYYTRGVQNIVRFGSCPTPVDDEIIALLQSQTGPEGFVRIGEDLKAGDRVMVVSGPLKNFVGIFEGRVKERERVSILLTTVSFQSRVLIEREMIKKVA